MSPEELIVGQTVIWNIGNVAAIGVIEKIDFNLPNPLAIRILGLGENGKDFTYAVSSYN